MNPDWDPTASVFSGLIVVSTVDIIGVLSDSVPFNTVVKHIHCGIGVYFVYPEGYLQCDNSSDSAKGHSLTSKRACDFLFVQEHFLRMHDKQIRPLKSEASRLKHARSEHMRALQCTK